MAVLWSSHHHLHSADAVSEWDYIDKDNGRGGYTGGRAALTAFFHILLLFLIFLVSLSPFAQPA